MLNSIKDDIDVRAALDWVVYASGDTAAFWFSINEAKESYRVAIDTMPMKLGNNGPVLKS